MLIGYGTSVHGGAPQRGRTRRVRSSQQRQGTRRAVRSLIVRRLARELGVDVARVVATGVDGAVTSDDVRRVATTRAPVLAARRVPGADGLLPFAPAAVVAGERMSMLHRTVSARLKRSRTEIPDATEWVDVDVTDLWWMRLRMAGAEERPPSFAGPSCTGQYT